MGTRLSLSDSVFQTVDIEARSGWGLYLVTFIAAQNPQRVMRHWYRTAQAGVG